MADKFFLSPQLALVFEEKRRASVLPAFPTMWMGASDGAGSRL